MARLINLIGLAEESIECEFIRKVSDVEKILNRGIAATAASKNGAINIWQDDNGVFRVQAMRNCIDLETKEYKTINGVNGWARKWLVKIK